MSTQVIINTAGTNAGPRPPRWLVSLVLGMMCLLLPLAVYADDRRATGNATDVDAAAVVSNESRALGVSGSDVDIADGYRSYSVLFGLYQDTKVNPLAIAGQLAAEGRYEEAAVLRCYPRTVHRALGGMDACVEKLGRPPAEEDPAVEFHREQQQLVEDLRAKVRNLEEELAKPPTVTQRTVIEQKPLLSEKQRAALQEVLNDEQR